MVLTPPWLFQNSTLILCFDIHQKIAPKQISWLMFVKDSLNHCHLSRCLQTFTKSFISPRNVLETATLLSDSTGQANVDVNKTLCCEKETMEQKEAHSVIIRFVVTFSKNLSTSLCISFTLSDQLFYCRQKRTNLWQMMKSESTQMFDEGCRTHFIILCWS